MAKDFIEVFSSLRHSGFEEFLNHEHASSIWNKECEFCKNTLLYKGFRGHGLEKEYKFCPFCDTITEVEQEDLDGPK